MLTLSNNVLWLLTGNNPDVSMEIARRSVRIRIDPKVDQAWKRNRFRHVPIETWVAENRPALVRAALVLVQAWIAAGQPRHKPHLGSFEEWSEVLGGILDVAQVNDFLGNLESLYEQADSQGQVLREFVAAWWAKYGDALVRADDLVSLCEDSGLFEDVLGNGNPRSRSSRMGKELQKHKDRVIDRYRLSTTIDKTTKSSKYSLALIAEEAAPSKVGPAPSNGADEAPGLPAPFPGLFPPSPGPSPGEKTLENKAIIDSPGLPGLLSQSVEQNHFPNDRKGEDGRSEPGNSLKSYSFQRWEKKSRKSRQPQKTPKNTANLARDLSPGMPRQVPGQVPGNRNAEGSSPSGPLGNDLAW
jgi:hypothetical protein